MATNYLQEGKVLEYTNSGSAITSGDVVLANNIIGVAITDIAATTGVGSIAVEGVWTLAKETGVAFNFGDALYWDSGNTRLTKTATGNLFAGICAVAAGSAVTTASVKLAGGASQGDAGGDLSVTGQITSDNGASANTLTLQSGTSNRIQLNDDGAGADGKLFDIIAEDTALTIRTRTDADGAGADAIVVTRSGTTVASVALSGTAITLTGAVGITGALTINANNIVTDTSTGMQIGTAAAQKLGFYGATPVIQYATEGTTSGFVAGTGTAVQDVSTFTGGSGTKAYTIGDLVLALKTNGIIAAS